MENPNPYNDGAYALWSNVVRAAVGDLWKAGASFDNLEDILGNAVEEACGKPCLVTIAFLDK